MTDGSFNLFSPEQTMTIGNYDLWEYGDTCLIIFVGSVLIVLSSV